MFLLRVSQLKEHDVFEFQKGHFTGNHWKNDSIYLSDDLFQKSELFEIINPVKNFSYYGLTEITKNEWNTIKFIAKSYDSKITHDIIGEIDEWAKNCFDSEDCFTICGI